MDFCRWCKYPVEVEEDGLAFLEPHTESVGVATSHRTTASGQCPDRYAPNTNAHGVRRSSITAASKLGSHMQPDFRIDDQFLCSGDTVNHQIAIGGHSALDQPERDRAELEVPRRSTDEPHLPIVGQQCRARPRQGLCGAIELQPDQAPGHATQGVNPRPSCLSPLAT